MTAKEYLQSKYEWYRKYWNQHSTIDDEFTASEMEAYHRSELLDFTKEMQSIGLNPIDDAEMVVDIYLKTKNK